MKDRIYLKGSFRLRCFSRIGVVKWEDRIDNLVVAVGKNLLLSSALTGANYTALVYMGLAGNSPTAAPSDTMASHPGWAEVGNANAPQIATFQRGLPVFAAASGGAIGLTSPVIFNFIAPGTIGGAFIVFGAGASNAIDNPGGVLLSIGAFQNGNKNVASGDILNTSYTLSV
jgi:hypothetical protein